MDKGILFTMLIILNAFNTYMVYKNKQYKLAIFAGFATGFVTNAVFHHFLVG